jgi:hypothetical protein
VPKKLTAAEKRSICEIYSHRVVSQVELGVRFTVDQSTISRIVNGGLDGMTSNQLRREAVARLETVWAKSSKCSFGVWVSDVRGPFDGYHRLIWRDMSPKREGVLSQTKSWRELDNISSAVYERLGQLRAIASVQKISAASGDHERLEAKTA